MHTISLIIATLSKEDKQKFIAELKYRNKRNDTKNITLFKILDHPDPKDHLDEIIYGKKAKGAYHALCKRLHDSLIDFIASKHMEGATSKEISALKLILVSKTFFEHNEIHLGIKTLAKAELMAQKYSLYRTLNEIFNSQLAYAHLHPSLDFKTIHQKYLRNKKNILQEENLNLFYASIQHELSLPHPQTSDIIERNLSYYSISINKDLSYQSLLKILKISNEVANITRNYYDILEFIEKARNEIETSERIQHEHLFDHIQILYYLSNTYFRIKNFEKSADALQKMYDHMHLQNRKYYSLFYGKYLLLENLLHIYTNQLDLAVHKIKSLDFKRFKKQEEQIHDLKLSLIVGLFLKENYIEALRVYKDFFHSDNWYAKKVGLIWVIKKNLLEILLLMELNYDDLIASRLASFRKKHGAHLIQHNEKRILDFLNLTSTYYFNKDVINTEQFAVKLEKTLNIENDGEDIFAISFYAWLKAKIIGKKTYKTCLQYINKT